MASRFRRSIRVLPGIKIHLSKTGSSVSLGIRGAHVRADTRVEGRHQETHSAAPAGPTSRAPESRNNHAHPRLLAVFIFLTMRAEAADSPPVRNAVLTGAQVVQVLDETIDWYRSVGAQQQSASQPNDLLIFHANAPIAEKVINLAFEFARADAEQLSAEEAENVSSPQALDERQRQIDSLRQVILAQIVVKRKQLGPGGKPSSDQMATLTEMQGELDVLNARRNLLDTMAEAGVQIDAKQGANALRARIDAMAISIPSSSSAAPAAVAPPVTAPTSQFTSTDTAADHVGIWDLSANVLRLSRKIDVIVAIDERAAVLGKTFATVRAPLVSRLKDLSVRSDALADQYKQADRGTLRNLRDQFDTLAWQFRQTSSMLSPLSGTDVLLQQYRHNLVNWRDAVKRQYYEALVAFAVRVGILSAMLAAVFTGSMVWRRLVLKYSQEPRRRHQLLLVRNITTWTLAIAIIGLTPATVLTSFATFAGLITAGVAVALQSVLLSIVGYFFLIGKYGVRVGDRVQIGSVVGEVIDLGLVRMHLLELNSQEPLSATGRVVTFANSIVLQASGGMLKQIPGVNFSWHETHVTLPPGSDSATLKDRLLQAVNGIVGGYQQEIVDQAKQIARTSESNSVVDAIPQVQLQFTAAGIDARVRYPVQLQHAAEIDERVSEALSQVIRSASG